MKKLLLSLLLLLPLLAAAQHDNWGQRPANQQSNKLQNASLTPNKDSKGRYGYVDVNGNQVIKCQFDRADPFIGFVARVCKNGQWGLINVQGKFVTDKYQFFERFAEMDCWLVGNNLEPIKSEDKRGFRPMPDEMGGTATIPVKFGARWGIISAQGNVTISPDQEAISNPVDGIIYLYRDEKFGFYNIETKSGILPFFSFIGTFNNQGICWVRKGGKIRINSETLDAFVDGGYMGIVDRAGKIIVSTDRECDNIGTFVPSPNELFSSRLPRKVSLAPFDPLPDSPFPYLWYTVEEEYAKPGIIDLKGSLIYKAQNPTILFAPTDGMMKYADINKYNKSNSKYLEKELARIFEDPKERDEDLISSWEQRASWYFYNLETKQHENTERLFPKFRFFPFDGGTSFAIDRDSTACFVVDKKFQKVSAEYKPSKHGFNEGFCVVGLGGKWGVINQAGAEVIPTIYDNIKLSVIDGMIPVQNSQTKLWGVVSVENKTLIPFAYDKINYRKKGSNVFAVKSNGKWGEIDKDNNVLLPIQYNDFIIPKKYPTDHYWVNLKPCSSCDGYYYFYDTAQKRITFPTENAVGYSDVWHFDNNGIAKVKRMGMYGAVCKDGTVSVPIKYKNAADVDNAIEYLRKNSLTAFREIDTQRYELINRGTCNTHRITEVIPKSDWDY